MFEEKRKSARRKVSEPAKVVFGATQIDCVVDDISDGGVRLIVKGELPEEFFLVTDSSPEPGRKCQLVWRLDDEAGAEFV